MPRLLRRLARYFEAENTGQIKYRQRHSKPQEYQESLTQPLEKRSPILYKRDNKHSFLLNVNPVIEKKLYEAPKQLAPLLPSQQRMPRPVDGRRGMNDVELDAAASPYMRMLCSPLRSCLFTRAILPKDMMVRFGGALDPQTKTRYLLPNNIEHPKYSKKSKGRSFWVSCRKEAVQHMATTGMHAMILPNLTAHAMITEQIEQLLQRRLIQELELLRDRLRTAPRETARPEEPVIRTLTEEELKSIFIDGKGELGGGAAILLFRAKVSQPEQPESTETSHDVNEILAPSRLITDGSSPEPTRFVPLYDTSFLPTETNKTVRNLIKEILRTEQRACRRAAGNKVSPKQSFMQQADSQAYLLRSTSTTLSRVDTVPVCIALWRLRLWAGQGWGESLWGPWELPKQPITKNEGP